MKTYVECFPCFLKQAIELARFATGDEQKQKEVVDAIARIIPDIPVGFMPPEMARRIYQVIREKFGDKDLYKDIKTKSNEMAMALYPRLKEKVESAQDRLLMSVEIAIAGNVIDYGVKNSLNIDEEIDKLFQDTHTHNKTIFDYEHFRNDLKKAREVLYLADNAGEVVFDRVLIEEFSGDKKVLFVVRGKPIINDALEEDAYACGIDAVATIMSSGADTPGTILKYCSDEFLKIFYRADFIISKGQGNYEALADSDKPIYFLFKAKCPVIARDAGVLVGDIVLMKGPIRS